MEECFSCRGELHCGKFFFSCENCKRSIHFSCLENHVPSELLGDVFFKYVCKSCSIFNKEEISRKKISWLNVLTLVLYNLRENSYDISRNGFFHWKIHICNLIEKNWTSIFGINTRKKKTWIGTVSGTLSHYSPQYFLSGQKSLNEPGWWKLSHSYTPAEIAYKHVTPILNEVGPSKHPLELDELCQEKFSNEFTDSPVTGLDASSSFTPIWNYSAVEEQESDSQSGSSSSVHQVHSTHDRAMYCRAYVQPSATLSNCLFADDEENNESLLDVDVDNCEVMEKVRDGLFNEGAQGSPQMKPTCLDGGLQEVANIFLKSTLVPILSSCTTPPSPPPLPDSIDEETLPQPEKSLFSLRTKELLAERYEERVTVRGKILSGMPMSEYVEAKLLKLMKRTFSPAAPSSVCRLLRKLTLRKLKCERGLYLFCLDRFFSESSSSWQQVIGTTDFPKAVRVLDRYKRSSHLTVANSVKPRKPAVLSNLISWCEPVFFRSPYTHRTLKPYIRRDRTSCPLWVQLMIELTETVKHKKREMIPPYFVAPIDYSYINAWHIPAINSLAREFFWPGIDLSDCLLYPDFSCVVMYRKLVVGFAVMVPDVRHNEAYISFLFTRPEWRRAGIASFMLYHLIQTCMGKDITLHVSATNPALILYQKFGFKVEEFIQDFYEMYLPINSRECKHALFLRLCR